MTRLRNLVLATLLGGALIAPTTASAASCAGASDPINASNIAAAEASLVCLLNEFRGQNGLGPLHVDAHLASAARGHSDDMVAHHYFDHVAPGGSSPSDRAFAAGYPSGTGIGENIAAAGGAATPQTLMNLWVNSAPHKANMLGTDYADVGIGVASGFYTGAAGATATQVFGTGTGDDTGDGCSDDVAAYEARVQELKDQLADASKKKRARIKKKLKRAKQNLRAVQDSCNA